MIPASRFRLPFGKAKSQCSTMLPANCRSRVEFRDLFFHRSSRSDRTIRVFSFEFLVFSNHSKPTTKNSKLCRLLTARREAIEPRGIISFCFLLSAFCFLLSASCFLLPASCSLLPIAVSIAVSRCRFWLPLLVAVLRGQIPHDNLLPDQNES